jgi:hypothetical protein
VSAGSPIETNYETDLFPKGVERSFASFPAAVEEATLNRIFSGVHFPQ